MALCKTDRYKYAPPRRRGGAGKGVAVHRLIMASVLFLCLMDRARALEDAGGGGASEKGPLQQILTKICLSDADCASDEHCQSPLSNAFNFLRPNLMGNMVTVKICIPRQIKSRGGPGVHYVVPESVASRSHPDNGDHNRERAGSGEGGAGRSYDTASGYSADVISEEHYLKGKRYKGSGTGAGSGSGSGPGSYDGTTVSTENAGPANDRHSGGGSDMGDVDWGIECRHLGRAGPLSPTPINIGVGGLSNDLFTVKPEGEVGRRAAMARDLKVNIKELHSMARVPESFQFMCDRTGTFRLKFKVFLTDGGGALVGPKAIKVCDALITCQSPESLAPNAAADEAANLYGRNGGEFANGGPGYPQGPNNGGGFNDGGMESFSGNSAPIRHVDSRAMRPFPSPSSPAPSSSSSSSAQIQAQAQAQAQAQGHLMRQEERLGDALLDEKDLLDDDALRRELAAFLRMRTSLNPYRDSSASPTLSATSHGLEIGGTGNPPAPDLGHSPTSFFSLQPEMALAQNMAAMQSSVPPLAGKPLVLPIAVPAGLAAVESFAQSLEAAQARKTVRDLAVECLPLRLEAKAGRQLRATLQNDLFRIKARTGKPSTSSFPSPSAPGSMPASVPLSNANSILDGVAGAGVDEDRSEEGDSVIALLDMLDLQMIPKMDRDDGSGRIEVLTHRETPWQFGQQPKDGGHGSRSIEYEFQCGSIESVERHAVIVAKSGDKVAYNTCPFTINCVANNRPKIECKDTRFIAEYGDQISLDLVSRTRSPPASDSAPAASISSGHEKPELIEVYDNDLFRVTDADGDSVVASAQDTTTAKVVFNLRFACTEVNTVSQQHYLVTAFDGDDQASDVCSAHLECHPRQQLTP